MKIFTLDSGREFAKRVVTSLNEIAAEYHFPGNIQLSPGEEIVFANREIKYVIQESVRGKDVYIVQLIDDPYSLKTINDNLIGLCTAVNAASYSDAKKITAVLPQFPYTRQDKIRGREPLTAKVICGLLEEAGVDKVITLDIHAEAIEGYFNQAKMENLHAGRILIKYIKEHIDLKNLIMVAPDIGSSERGRFFSKQLGLDLAIIDKVRNYETSSTIQSMRLVGEVEGKNVFLNDDMVATGGTLLAACELLKNRGAQDIYISVSLPFFSNNAYQKFDEAYKKGYFKEVIGTDAVFWGEEFQKKHPWYTELSMAGLFAEVILSLNQHKSVSKLLE